MLDGAIIQQSRNASNGFSDTHSALEPGFVFPVEARVTALKLSDF
jgi:hypothetical protein